MIIARPLCRSAAVVRKPLPQFGLKRAQSSQRPAPEPAAISPRWLAETKSRIGKCLAFGMERQCVDEAAKILQILTRDWRELIAGSEGFLTSKTRAGLDRQAVVWGEQDSMGHVNNVMYVRYAESGRCNWTRNFGKYIDTANRKQWAEMLTSRDVGLILKSITIDYKFPMTWPDRISVYHKIRSRPEKTTESLILDVMILSEVRQRPAAKCLEDIVVYDYKKGRKTSLPPFMLEQFVRTFELQEAAKKENNTKAEELSSWVTKLEKQTWDRPDAKEDFGQTSV